LVFILVLFLITLFVIVFSLIYINHYVFYFIFVVLIVLFVLRIVLFLVSERNHILFFSWDILGLISFLLVIYYNNWVSLRGSLETLMRNRFGDLFLIFILVIGEWTLITIALSFFLNFLLTLASWTKRVQFPFHGWLVKAMEAPTPVRSLVHRSTLVTAGFILFYSFSVEESRFFLLMTFVSSMISSLVASLLALTELDIKQLVAWRTISQISLVFLFFCLGYQLYAFVHLLRHAIFKRLLFILVGLLIRLSRGDQDLRKVVYYGHLKYVVVGVLICLFSLRALFFLGGILSKDLFLEYFLEESFLFLLRLVLMVEIVITFFYSYKVVKSFVAFGSLIKLGFSLRFFVVLLVFRPLLFYLISVLLQNFLLEGSYNNFRFWLWMFFLGFYLIINIIYLAVSFLNERNFLANYFFSETLSIFYLYYNLEASTLNLNIQFLELLFSISKFKEVINSKFVYLLLLMLLV